jgi:hypothetical protein
MVLLGDVAQVEARYCPIGDSANLDTRYELLGLRQTYHRLRKSFWLHKMELLGDVGHVESRFGLFGDSVSASAI